MSASSKATHLTHEMQAAELQASKAILACLAKEVSEIEMNRLLYQSDQETGVDGCRKF